MHGHTGYLLFKEMRDARALLAWNGWQHFVGSVEVASHDGSLVLEHGQQQRETDDVQLLVTKIQTVLARNITEQVHDTIGKKSENRTRN